MPGPFEVTASSGLRSTNVLRRYMDLPKYLDLLRTRSLYFRRADRFPDRFEGALTPSIRRGLDELHRAGHSNEDAETFYRRARVGALVSCWSLGAGDNMALWKLYGGDSASVAVTTTVGRVADAASQWPELTYISKVKYIDHAKNPSMAMGHHTDPLEFKHEAYSYEDEVRIIISRHRGKWEQTPEDCRLPVGRLNDFIRTVVVAPEAGQWFYDIIVDATRRYKVAAPVNRSTLTYIPK